MDQAAYLPQQQLSWRSVSIPEPVFFEALNSERSYLLDKLHRADDAATDLLKRIAHLQDTLNQDLDRATIKKNQKLIGWFKAKLRETTKQEQTILSRLGQISYEIQYKDRWSRVERERLQKSQEQAFYGFHNIQLDTNAASASSFLPLSPLNFPTFYSPVNPLMRSGLPPTELFDQGRQPEYFGQRQVQNVFGQHQQNHDDLLHRPDHEFYGPQPPNTSEVGNGNGASAYQWSRTWDFPSMNNEHPQASEIATQNSATPRVADPGPEIGELQVPNLQSNQRLVTDMDINSTCRTPLIVSSGARIQNLDEFPKELEGERLRTKRLSLPIFRQTWDDDEIDTEENETGIL